MSNTIVDSRKCRRCGVRVRSQYLTNGLCKGCKSDITRFNNKYNPRIDPSILKEIIKIKI
jgi:hypothetical protein